MTRYNGGEMVKAGFYCNLAGWEMVTAKKGEALPGTKETRYLRIPTLLLMAVGPILGALMVVFLPLIGFVMLAGFSGAKVVAVCRRVLNTVAAENEA